MEDIYICELCQEAYEADELSTGVKVLKTFHGYTVDVRLQEFRKMEYGKQSQFIPFGSIAGERLLALMHEEVTQ